MQVQRSYPKSVICKDGLEVEIRLLLAEHIESHVSLLRSLDEREHAKLPCDVLQSGYPMQLRREIDDGSVVRLVAWKNSKEIIGLLALYRGTSKWTRHTGRVVQITHPDYRRSGVAMALFDETVPLAESLQIRKIYTELTDFHKEAITMVKRLGMKKESTLHQHVHWIDGIDHNLYIYSMSVMEAEKALKAIMQHYVRLDHRI